MKIVANSWKKAKNIKLYSYKTIKSTIWNFKMVNYSTPTALCKIVTETFHQERSRKSFKILLSKQKSVFIRNCH